MKVGEHTPTRSLTLSQRLGQASSEGLLRVLSHVRSSPAGGHGPLVVPAVLLAALLAVMAAHHPLVNAAALLVVAGAAVRGRRG